jgi:hypothetical protein
MNKFKYFLECYFNMAISFMDLDDQTDFFRETESQVLLDTLISELKDIIENVKYDEACKCIWDHEDRRMNKRMAEEVVRHIHSKLKGKKPRWTLKQLLALR